MPTIISYMLLLLGTSIFIVHHFVTVPATLQFDESKISLRLHKRNMFYQFNKIECGWDNVAQFTENHEHKSNRSFILLKFKNPGNSNILMMKNKADDGQLAGIWADVNAYRKAYIVPSPAAEVKLVNRGFYSGPFMRLLAYAGVCMVFAFTILCIFAPSFRTTENILKLLVLVAFLIPFLVNYFATQKRERELNS